MAPNLKLFGLVGIVFFISVISANAQECPQDKVIFCYYASWSIYRPTFGSFGIDDIDPFACTHLVYGFAGLNLEGYTFSLDPWNDLPELGGNQQFYHFRMLKEKNPCLKVLLSIGGWDEGSEKYSVMAFTAESRKRFADHLLRFVVYYGFDGIDLDWEYPAARGGLPEDKENLVDLLEELSCLLKPRNRVLAIAVGAGQEVIKNGYNISEIAKHVDYILVMTYDYHTPNLTSHVVPLHAEENFPNSVSGSMEIWMEECPPEKLVLGVLTSGRSYTLENPANNHLGSVAIGPGKNAPYTNVTGFVSYYETCDFNADGWERVYGPNHETVYITEGDQWITYEDPTTIAKKVQYAVDQKFAGIMVYSIDTDDFRSFCDRNVRNGLQDAILRGLGMRD